MASGPCHCAWRTPGYKLVFIQGSQGSQGSHKDHPYPSNVAALGSLSRPLPRLKPSADKACWCSDSWPTLPGLVIHTSGFATVPHSRGRIAWRNYNATPMDLH